MFKDVRHHEIHTAELLLGPTQPSVCKSEMAIEKYRGNIGLSLGINHTLTDVIPTRISFWDQKTY